ncbi:FAD-binding and (Fe-S)-binding domain-containing protein [Ferrimonas balearica]|uniref:FAD-binding and (Fe-S)-binding domain-containing protein n=1 Tax=Ferrimonas balearica TaxID=44012 RepID=UPI001C9911D4|nr:FAD-binding and (Fe-S)-binding domain-containing protein [Ferrimonas balearica]MBY5920534.1 FAD-binding oxidoreductase [Ferrimonas balearica]MBY5996781.1 FAD-binding oxidoreductase [Ferrimonas balearica]
MAINYTKVHDDLKAALGEQAVTDDPVRRFAWSTDGSYFRIVPELVVRVNHPDEVAATLAVARAHQAPVTFRAAGTSLSGQAVGEGILVMLGYDGFRQIRISDDRESVTLGAAVIGAEANASLKPFDKKIGPDPATLASCMVGGIVNNNASGMCCGTAQNSYQTIESAKLLFADGTRLDTGDTASREAFAQARPDLLANLTELATSTQADPALAKRIRHKYAIKNTTGYSLNALVDFRDPFDLINHLVVGSEGTLAFVEEVTYRTVEEARFKASAMAVFHNMVDAASAIPPLKTEAVAAAELLDWASIKAVTGKKGMPEWLSELPEGTAILLIECRANDEQTLHRFTEMAAQAISHINTLRPIEFSTDPLVYGQYWAMRSGLFPIIGGERPKGTSVIIEDVAFRVEDLADAAADLSELFQIHGYPEGVIYGHALDGNFHFIITPMFRRQTDIEQFDRFMQAVAELVVNKYDGSMKAEHGTGRAVAPFVELEWGTQAYQLMKRIKAAFDPEELLNPGVILNDDAEVHIKRIKQAAVVDDWVDRCIECGFCEKTCPTSSLNMSPRHRITTLREIARLDQAGQRDEAEAMRKASQYDVIDTCTACQLCTIACPVDNNMGMLVRQLRGEQLTSTAQKVLDFQANHYGAVNQVLSGGFDLLHGLHRFTGDTFTGQVMALGRKISGEVPYWDPDFPRGGSLPKPTLRGNGRPVVVYFAACGGRTFGPTPKDPDGTTLPEVMVTLLERAGYEVRVPDNTRALCCGQMWESKGDYKNADGKRAEMIAALKALTEDGRHPVIVDALSCTKRTLQDAGVDYPLLDAVDFIEDTLLPKLTIHRRKASVALHVGCTASHMNAGGKMAAIAARCADQVIRPDGIHCCGFAGEKGLFKPEINAESLRHLKEKLPEQTREGYYANRMCEVGLTRHSGISYRHLAYLVEECTRPD